MKSYELSQVNKAFEEEQDIENKKDEVKKNIQGEEDAEMNKSSSKEPDTEGDASVSCMKVSKTVALTFCLASLALFLEIVGSSMEYIAQLISGTREDVTRVLIGRSVGYFVGSIAGGYLCDRYSRLVDIFLGVTFLIAAVGTIASPWCNNSVLLGFMFFLQGIAQGTVCTGGNAVVIKLWGKHTNAPLVSQHLAFGVGALVAPQLVNGFVKEYSEIMTSTPMAFSSPYNTSIEMTTLGGPSADLTDVKYAYIISGIIAGCFGILFIVFYFIDKDSKDIGPSLNFSEILHPGSCANGDTIFSVIFFSLFFAFNFQVGGVERYFSRYFYDFTRDSKFNYSETQAANILSMFWLCFTAGRAANLIAINFLSPIIILAILAVGNLANGIVFVLWANDVELVLWIVTGTFGFFLSPLFPTGLVWANLYVQITAVGVSLGYVGTAVGDLIYQYLGGYLFSSIGADTFVYIILTYSILLAVFCVTAQIMSSKHGRRDSHQDKSNTEDDNVVIMTISKI